MSIHIPTEVVLFLNAMGIPYPDVDVDQVRELSRTVREFAGDVRETYDGASGAVKDLGSAMSGNSYQAILVGWAHHKEKMAELDSAFGVTAQVLDVAADVIEAIQIAVLIELAALVASYTVAVLSPIGPAAGPLLASAASRILKAMAQVLVWYIAAEVMIKAIEPLLKKFDEFLRDALRPPPLPTTASESSLYIDPEEVNRYVAILENHADDLVSHGEKFGEKLNGFDFETPGLTVQRAEWPDPSEVAPAVDAGLNDQPMSTSPVPSPGSDSETSRPTVGELSESQETGQPTPGASSAKGTEAGSSGPGDGHAEGSAGSRGGASPTTDSGRPAAVAPESMPLDGPGSALSATGNPAERIQSSGHDGNSAGSPQSAHSLERPESAAAQHQGGATAATSTPGTDQWTPSASPAQSQATSAANGQRPADATTGKTQGAGRAGADSKPGDQRPSGRKASQTPWSRGRKKVARVAPTAKPSDEKVPAVSAGETGNRGGEPHQAVPPISDNPPHTGPQVFVPDTAPPPTESSSVETPETEQVHSVLAEPSPKEGEPAAGESRSRTS
ncbi:WXG100-like domain-containing protein [Nocardia sp. NBC_01329]|uniref:WXG100-like domain-containing protein n=1 Tax=Nocardia sp. NBC_01329 TaxID=2903594 RepID=UPI002E13649B|nr:hypothetical protein OG405_03350 [Nocardia sp. NBC_01329]